MVVRQRSLRRTFSKLEARGRENLHKPVHGPEERHVPHGGVDGGEDDDHEDQGGAGQGSAGYTGSCGCQPGEKEIEWRQWRDSTSTYTMVT